MNADGHFAISAACAALLAISNLGCEKSVPPGTLVLTESPARSASAPAADVLDLQYPAGSRVVLLKPPYEAGRTPVLSEGLAAAGSPVVSYDGRKIYFVGKARSADEWQIYSDDIAEGHLQALTAIPGGAMNPALLPNGNLVFVSPVPRTAGTNSLQLRSALFTQSAGGKPQQLTFGSLGVADPTVLADGRILFVAEGRPSGSTLFTMNNDGTEVTAFAAPTASANTIRQPRQCDDGRILFLMPTTDGNAPIRGIAEFLRMARPFHGFAPFFPNLTARIRSLQPADNGELFVCSEAAARTSLALYRVNPGASDLGKPLFAPPDWDCGEAAELKPHPQPMGRLSTVDLTKQTGRILCLNANLSADSSHDPSSVATRVRILAEPSPGSVCALGEVPLQADGSFLAEVPADVPLGFETLDDSGAVLRREAPLLWVRPAENRACVGCHEPPNRAPHNHRPLAVSVPVPCLSLTKAKPAKRKAE
ncbi:MAG: hypothetical protein ACLQVY_17935 [Limisphaerales bacterium]